MVTRKLIAKATNTFLAFPSDSPVYKKHKSTVVGVPTRYSAVAKEAKTTRDKFNLLIFGGSQGAKAINESFSDFLVNNLAYLDKLEVIHQVGKNNLDQVPQSLKDHPNYSAVEFIHDMKEKYQWADVSISRAGASTISELTQMGLPSILVPLPTAADDHQKKNALWVAEAGAGVLLEQKDLSHEQWASVLGQMLDWDRLQEMSAKALGIAQADAAAQIASEIS
jgi:UDP-N-acetylglucosamine--N-acetylmuramyl-(pentapeptide) pyrophosphoryl-undecaprenol N-acetylglucosamine transferase